MARQVGVTVYVRPPVAEDKRWVRSSVRFRTRAPSRRRLEVQRAPFPRYGWLALIAALVIVIPLTTYGLVARRLPGTPACPDRAPLTIQADPRIASVVSAVLRDIGPGPECIPVQVDQRSSSDLAFDIAQPQSTKLTIPLPDVWIPDSSAWLSTASTTADGGRRVSAEAALSVASSPIVAAMRRDTATQLGWPGKQLGWNGLLGARDGTLKVAITNAQTDGAGLLAVSAQQQGVGTLSSGLLAFTRRVHIPRISEFQVQSPTSAVAAGFFDAISAAEQDVLAYNKQQPQQPLVAEYDPNETVSFDFPFIPLTDAATGTIPLDKKRDEAIVQARLMSAQGEREFAEAGFRTTTGRLDGPYRADQGVVAAPQPGLAPPLAATVRQVQATWPSLARRGRVLVVVDESGSMGARLSGSRLTKMQLAKQGLSAAVKAVAPDSDVGLWTFTSSPNRDYHVRVPLGRVDDAVGAQQRRSALADAVDALDPVPGGGTGLYDTTLAAFRNASQNYGFGRLNAILIFTDGRNEDDPGGIGLSSLLGEIRGEFEDSQPVRILTFAYGQDADNLALARISHATGGQAYRAVRPEQVAPLLTKALAEL
jgi:Ca-activated chloride channel homolog